MQEFISSVCALVMICAGIAVMVGKLEPAELLNRFLAFFVVAICGCAALSLIANVVVPVLLQSLVRLARGAFVLALLLLLVVALVVITAAVAGWFKKRISGIGDYR